MRLLILLSISLSFVFSFQLKDSNSTKSITKSTYKKAIIKDQLLSKTKQQLVDMNDVNVYKLDKIKNDIDLLYEKRKLAKDGLAKFKQINALINELQHKLSYLNEELEFLSISTGKINKQITQKNQELKKTRVNYIDVRNAYFIKNNQTYKVKDSYDY